MKNNIFRSKKAEIRKKASARPALVVIALVLSIALIFLLYLAITNLFNKSFP